MCVKGYSPGTLGLDLSEPGTLGLNLTEAVEEYWRQAAYETG